MPDSFHLPTAVKILDVRQDNYRTKTFVLDATLDAYPGQFVMAWLPRFDEKPFSLVNANPVTLMISAVGPFTRLVHEKQVGDRLWIRGPFGNGFRVDNMSQNVVLVGGGYGVAPLLWLAQTLAGQAKAVTTIIGARTADDLLYTKHFSALSGASSSDFSSHATHYDLQITTDDGTAGRQGRVTDVLEPLLTAKNADTIFACGPHGMLDALDQQGRRYNVPCQLSWEAYMRCAIGICGSCEHAGSVLCLDGPVLSNSEL